MRFPSHLLSGVVAATTLVTGVGQRCPVEQKGTGRSDRTVGHAQGRVPSFVEQTGSMPASLRESSGVAVSRAHPGVIWSHNDSGDGPVLYALDLTGKESASFRIRGAHAEDWEDIARGVCPAASGSVGDCLFVGDIGDNEEGRRTYEIYVIPEPDPATVAQGSRVIAGARRIVFAYPDGPHNSESLAVTPMGDLFVITKVRSGGTHLFRISAGAVERAMQRDTVLVASLLDTLSIQPSFFLGHTATGAAISPSGTRLVVRTYTQLYFYLLGQDGHVVADGAGAPCLVGGLALVGEGVDFLDDDTVVLTSESVPSHPGEIHRVRC